MMKLGRFFQIAALIMIAAGAQPAYSAFWQWSKTAATNATADPTINWAEGMSPSSVNDSARAMMARAAEYRDDISGALTLGGTSTVYTLTTNQGLNATPTTGQMIAFKPNVTNGSAATLTTDGGTAWPLQSTAGTALPSGSILAGTPYRASFSGTAWVLEGGYGNPYAVPLGGLLASTIGTAPNSNFILPAGQCISTTTYATYWVAMGSPASGACAGGEFAVIDMRGRLPLALDNLNGTAANRYTSSGTGCGTAMTSIGAVCANAAESSSVLQANLPSVNFVVAAGQTVSVSSVNYVTGLNGAGSGGIPRDAANQLTALTSTGTVTSTGTAASGGSGTAMSRAPHVIGLSYFLRVI